MKKAALCLLVPLAAVLGACEVFTTSWAAWAARDINSIPLTTDNAQDLVDENANDPQRSLEILKKLEGAVRKEKDPSKKAKLQAAALDAAVNASGLISSALGEIETLVDALSSSGGSTESTLGAVGESLLNIMNGIKNTGPVSDALRSIIQDPEDPAFVKEAGSTQLVITAFILAYDTVKGDDAELSMEAFEGRLKEQNPQTLPDNLDLSLGLLKTVSKGNSQFNEAAQSVVDMIEQTNPMGENGE